ncbi:hypothetical protein AYO37_00250 [Opitutia bacterium SCGC AG-212-L18]|nr:hypothetical protein AYO37_00250 [Opitutae bacterium SCGC AG-212-L18]
MKKLIILIMVLLNVSLVFGNVDTRRDGESYITINRKSFNEAEKDEALIYVLEYPLKKDIVEVVKKLLSDGADPKARSSRALLLAWENCDKQLVDLLLEYGADPKAPGLENYQLICAVKENDIERVRSLLEQGADPKFWCSYALIVASLRGYQEIAALLLEYGAYRKVQDPEVLIMLLLKMNAKFEEIFPKAEIVDLELQDSQVLAEAEGHKQEL